MTTRSRNVKAYLKAKAVSDHIAGLARDAAVILRSTEDALTGGQKGEAARILAAHNPYTVTHRIRVVAEKES